MNNSGNKNQIGLGADSIRESPQRVLGTGHAIYEQHPEWDTRHEETSINNLMGVINNQDTGFNNQSHQAVTDWLRANLDNEEVLLQFLDDPNNNLEDQPTDILIVLAQKLKERRMKHFKEMEIVQEQQDALTQQKELENKRLMEEKRKLLQAELFKA